MKKKISLVLLAFFLSSCAGNSFKYTEKPTPIVRGKSKFYVSEVNIKFVSGMLSKARGEIFTFQLPEAMKKDFSSYPDEKKVSVIFKELLEKKLQEKEIYSSDQKNSDTFTVVMKADYERLGLLWSKTAYHSFIMSHNIVVLKDGKEVARSVLSNYKAGRGYFDDIASNAKVIAANKGPKDEEEDINIVVSGIAKELSELGLNLKVK